MALVLAATDIVNGTILILITLLVLPIAAVAFARSGAAWKGIGSSGRFSIDPDVSQRKPFESTSIDPEAQEAEIRQFVLARNERRLRQGRASLDVEAEVERQLADFIGSS